MNPYIRNIDRTNPIGDLIAEYGENQWNIEFYMGFIYGLSIGTICCVILLK